MGEEIIYRQVEISTNDLIIDTENTIIEKMLIDNKEFYYYEDKDIKNMIWIQDAYRISISSSIEQSEIIKMSVSVK